MKRLENLDDLKKWFDIDVELVRIDGKSEILTYRVRAFDATHAITVAYQKLRRSTNAAIRLSDPRTAGRDQSQPFA